MDYFLKLDFSDYRKKCEEFRSANPRISQADTILAYLCETHPFIEQKYRILRRRVRERERSLAPSASSIWSIRATTGDSELCAQNLIHATNALLNHYKSKYVLFSPVQTHVDAQIILDVRCLQRELFLDPRFLRLHLLTQLFLLYTLQSLPFGTNPSFAEALCIESQSVTFSKLVAKRINFNVLWNEAIGCVYNVFLDIELLTELVDYLPGLQLELLPEYILRNIRKGECNFAQDAMQKLFTAYPNLHRAVYRQMLNSREVFGNIQPGSLKYPLKYLLIRGVKLPHPLSIITHDKVKMLNQIVPDPEHFLDYFEACSFEQFQELLYKLEIEKDDYCLLASETIESLISGIDIPWPMESNLYLRCLQQGIEISREIESDRQRPRRSSL